MLHLNQKNSEGKRDGIWLFFGSRGNLNCMATYYRGVLNGLYVIYYNSPEKPYCIYYYHKGIMEGEHVKYDYQKEKNWF